MSTSHSITIKTHALFNKKTIKKIYDTASALHYSFFKFEEKGLNMAAYLSFEEFYNHIICSHKADMIEDFSGMLWLKIQNTVLLCQITKGDDNLLELHFSPHLCKWNNWYLNITDSLDYQRYTRSLIHLCMGFPIKSIETYSIG